MEVIIVAAVMDFLETIVKYVSYRIKTKLRNCEAVSQLHNLFGTFI